ncbi:hypothetical protein [Microbulbifer halophilus]|uniref:GNAT family N-acetyltransferase n=1 Tax=Microbulbifer halophilus TaxID=453963 RepID=A0ABW5EBA3_9GAMM|nr:hypothetical protein [Microbulbifer halophilus]MCW8127927.1 hypothetical protein [Microbulbifer halophilus]
MPSSSAGTLPGLVTVRYGGAENPLVPLPTRTTMIRAARPEDAGQIMEKVAHFKAAGHKVGRWIDVGCWQGLLGPGAPE